MRKILYALVILLGLASCKGNFHTVKLPNGSLVSAEEKDDRSYKSGDTVCITLDDHWYIDNQGKMQDTTYYLSGRRADSSTYLFTYKYKIGVIK